MAVLGQIEPKDVFGYFEKICEIPHGSGNTAQISDFLVDFAKEHGLSYVQDEMGNVVIRKPASAGYENAPGVILQGHMDMVAEKKPGSAHDFTKDGLDLEILDGNYISAKDTTLGGDDGIAVAYGLALLAGDYAHPALEVLVTVDEEIGLLGAEGFDCSHLNGKRLINLDSEAEGSIWISCAGGLSGISHLPVNYAAGEGLKYELKISGLMGGHSGAEIDKMRLNANIAMGRILYHLAKTVDFEIAKLAGGLKDNAIPRECTAVLLVAKGQGELLEKGAAKLTEELRAEYRNTDEGVTVTASFLGEGEADVLTPVSREKVIFFLMNMPDSIQKMSGSIEGLVETSSNLGVLKLSETELLGSSGVRSSVESARDAVSAKIEYLTEFLGGEYEVKGAYPAWEYNPESPLRDLMVNVYEEMYGNKPNVVAIHAGLECGLFYKKIEGLDCVSIGPNMKDIHTTEEVLDIASTKRVWEYLLKVLEQMKA
ncbi:MAG: aminoacyl-histidine dipeptidase [Blautia sp.]|jgi:dipeptidase D